MRAVAKNYFLRFFFADVFFFGRNLFYKFCRRISGNLDNATEDWYFVKIYSHGKKWDILRILFLFNLSAHARLTMKLVCAHD